MSDVAIHLAFPDGVLCYHCETCDQRCCKTKALAVFPAEVETLLKRHPALELVSPQHHNTIALFATPPSGCWFLQKAAGIGRCGLYPKNGGRSARPRACTLFPFNLFGTLSEALVVAPNGLCPLTVVPPETGQGVSHAEVIDLLTRLGAAGTLPEPLRPEEAQLIPLERLIRGAVTASVEETSPVPLVAFAEVATTAFLRDVNALDDLDLSPLASEVKRTYDALDQMITVLGIAAPSHAAFAAVAPMIAAWTPTLRLFAFGTLPLAWLPRAVLALALHAAHWQQLRPQRQVIPQTLMQMVAHLGPTIGLLAAWDSPWAGRPLAEVPLAPGEIPADALDGFFGPLGANEPVPHRRALLLRRLAAAFCPPTLA